MTFDRSRPFTDPTLRIEYAPNYNDKTSGGINSIILRDDEDVIWHWCEFGEDRYVNGYTIIKKTDYQYKNNES